MVLRRWLGSDRRARGAASPAPEAFDERPGGPAPAKVGAERREHPRVPVELEVRVRFASNEELVRSRTINLSHGGVFIAVRDLRPIGTRARLVLVVGDRTITIGGVVAHTVESTPEGIGGVGILFKEIAAGDRALIDMLIEAQLEAQRARTP